MEKFRGIYRIPSARWAAWGYGSNAAYYITVCTANRAHDFGEIANGSMRLTRLGQAAVDCWNEIPAHFPFVVLDAFVVMPNHVHGILVIEKRGDQNVGRKILRLYNNHRNDPETNSARNPKTWHPSSAGTKSV